MTYMIDICLVPFVYSVNYLSVTLDLYLFIQLYVFLLLFPATVNDLRHI